VSPSIIRYCGLRQRRPQLGHRNHIRNPPRCGSSCVSGTQVPRKKPTLVWRGASVEGRSR
jgi:hypothetical protein